jgi:hypothetical protein
VRVEQAGLGVLEEFVGEDVVLRFESHAVDHDPKSAGYRWYA